MVQCVNNMEETKMSFTIYDYRTDIRNVLVTPQIRSPLPATRAASVEEPDALTRPLGSFAPDWRENFFVVPPPPGVHREEPE